VNKVLTVANEVLASNYRPFDDFAEFDEAVLPTNSDVTMILMQYMQEAERFRSDNVVIAQGSWRYVINGAPSDIRSKAPTKLGGDR
jgi:hypothetical protein